MYNKLTIFLLLASYLGLNFWLYADTTPPVAEMPLVQIENGWVRAVPPQLTITAAYLQLKNLTQQKLILVGASTPAFAKVEMHQTVFEDNMVRMVPVEKLVISPQEVVRFKPKGLHFMLMDRQQPLQVGDAVMLTLQFEKNKTQTAKLEIQSESNTSE
jgi:copper(I)-binding protein